MARINNAVSTRGSVASVQLHFAYVGDSPLYLEPGETSEYGHIVHYLSERIHPEQSIQKLKTVAGDLSHLFEVIRLDLVMHLIDQIQAANVGITAEAEFEVVSTGHGSAVNVNHRLLIKTD